MADAQSPWWCRRCHAYVELMDAGDVYPQCAECHSRHVVQRSEADQALTSEEEKRRVAVMLAHAPQPETVSLNASLVAYVKKHLPREKRDLRKLARSGFWFCYADECRQITETRPGPKFGELECVCCGAVLTKEANWTAPALTEEQSTKEAA